MISAGGTVGAPIVVETLAQLCDPPYSFQEKAFRFNTACFGGERYVCLKDQQTGSDKPYQVGIVDIAEDFEVSRRTTRKADGAMKNPLDNILALRVEGAEHHFIQVFNLDSKERLGDFTFLDEIVFWKWLQNRCLIVITRSNVYHWFVRGSSEDPETEPVLMFARSGKLAEGDVQIINYAVDNEANPSEIKWCLLAGIHLSSTDRKLILGCLQLFSVEKQQQQFLEGHSGCFGTLILDELTQDPINVFSFTERKNNVSKLYVMDIYSPRGEGKPAPFKATCEFSYPSDHPNDLPIAQHLSTRHGVIFNVTKAGFVMVFDAKTAQRIVCERVSQEGVFLCTGYKRTGGVLMLNRKGTLYSIHVNESQIIPHVQAHCADGLSVALSLAKRYGYPAADEYLTQLFRQALQNQRYGVAARIAAMSKGGSIRTPATLAAFRAARANPDEQSPVVQYFNALLELGGRLTSFESLELMKPVVAQNRRELPEKWLQEDKLDCSEALGDLVKQMDDQMASRIYQRANCHQKVIQFFVERGQFNDILSYVKRKRYSADYSFLLRSMLNIDPMNAVTFTRALLENEPPLMDMDTAVDVFIQQGRTQEISGILTDVLKSNRADQANLQTRLFEINLASSPQTAETLFQQNLFTHYDRSKIAKLCEKAGLFRRALEHYSEMTDIKRVMMRCGNQMNIEWLGNFCNQLKPEACIDVLTDMLRTNRGNLQSVVQVTIKFHEKLGTDHIIKMYEDVGSTEGLYYFLGSVMAFTSDPEIHYKYIEAAAKLQNFTEVERVVRESKNYDAVRVKEFLKSIELADPKPLIYVCDIHSFIEELAEYLYRRNLTSYIEVYVTKVNAQAAASVIITLLDLGCDESFITELLQAVRGGCPLEPLIPEMEKRGRLPLILPWMEARIGEGNTDPILNNAVAKVYVDSNQDAETFLSSNVNYDPRVLGAYCEARDPHLAVIAYQRGQCDDELINITNSNGLFRLQAKYLVQRKCPEVWMKVLSSGATEHRRLVVDQITATALPEATSLEEISVAVKAFVAANIPNELLELLERVVLQKSIALPQLSNELSKATSLQNLLLLTAMSADPSKVKDYINRLDSFDHQEVARVAVQDFQLYEEALLIYQKNNLHSEAMEVLFSMMNDYEGAEEYAERVKTPSVWLILAQALLSRAESLLSSSLESAGQTACKSLIYFAKAESCSEYRRLIDVAEKTQKYCELADFLRKLRSQRVGSMGEVDSELAYCLAKTQQWASLETFLVGPQTSNNQQVGDRLFEEGLAAESAGNPAAAQSGFKAARVLYARASNPTKLTMCHLKLRDHSAAFDAAKRAGSVKCWTEVALAAITTNEFKIAKAAGLNILSHSDQLERVIEAFEDAGHFDELLAFLEAGVASGKGGIGLYTEMAVVYAKFRPEKLADFLKSSTVVSAGRLNVPKLIKICESERLWSAAVLLHVSYNEFDQAANTMLAHASLAWDHDMLTTVLQKATNADLVYRSVNFYLEQHPLLLNSMLVLVSKKLDYGRLLHGIRKHPSFVHASDLYASPIGLIQPWLEEEQQKANASSSAVNDALNDLYVDICDVESLRRSITTYGNFDQSSLAAKLEEHELIEFKQLALYLYERTGRYSLAVDLANKFKQYGQAMAIAMKSGDGEVSERLLKYFADTLKSPQLFAACLHVCHKQIRPEVALEMAWIAGYSEETMPYMIGRVRDFSARLKHLENQVEKLLSHQAEKKEKHGANDLVTGLMGMGNLAMLPPSPFPNFP